MHKDRLLYIDLLKAFAIFCVVWGHSIQYLSNNSSFFEDTIFKFIYSFHMPLFMTISGYFFTSSIKLSPSHLIKKKFYQLLVPCISWTTLYTIVRLNYSNYFNKLIVDFWYLKSLFICYLIAYLSIKLFKKSWIAYPISILLILCTPPIANKYNIHTMYPFFCLGALIYQNQSTLFRYQKLLISISSICFILLLLFWKGEYTMYTSPFYPIQYHPLTFNFTKVGIATYRFFIGLSGTIFFFLIFKKLSANFSNNKWIYTLANVGKYTMGIYIVQFYLIESYRSIPFLTGANHLLFNILFAPLISCFVIVFSIFIIKLIQRNKTLSFLFLGIKKQ